MATSEQSQQEPAFSDAQIKSMPLHAITEVIGEAGLQRRFYLEVDQFDPEAQTLLDKAFKFGNHWHAEQRRQREPHMNHVLRVAIRIMHHYQFKDVNVIVAALLHDVVEDQAVAITGIEDEAIAKQRALEIVAGEFNQDVADLVAAVTNPEFDKDTDWHTQYRDHVIELLKTNPRAGIIKISDFTDNATGIIYTPAAKADRLAPKYLPLVPEFKAAIEDPSVPLSEEVKRHIISQMDLTSQRLASVIKASTEN